MTVRYKTTGKRVLTEAELEALRRAENAPVTCDDDCPELTPEMEEAFREARRKNPIGRVSVTLNLKRTTIERAKSWDEDYLAFLGKVLDEAMSGYREPEKG